MWDGKKHHELRFDGDRGFEVGDIALLHEWNPAIEGYTGRAIKVEITYVSRAGGAFFGLQEEYCVFSFVVLASWERWLGTEEG